MIQSKEIINSLKRVQKEYILAFTAPISWLRQAPVLSKSIAVFFISSIWLFAWICVFFTTVIVLDISSSALDFVMVLTISVVVETIIRFAENSKFIIGLSKPETPQKKIDNAEIHTTPVSTVVFAFLLLAVALYTLYFHANIDGLSKIQISSTASLSSTVEWVYQVLTAPLVVVISVVSLVVRVATTKAPSLYNPSENR